MKAKNNGIITKANTEQTYTIIPNSIIQSTELSFDAIGVLTYLLSLPTDWSIVKTNLHKQIKIGEIRLDKAFKELINNKYIHTIKTSTKTGWVYTYNVFPVPTENNKYGQIDMGQIDMGQNDQTSQIVPPMNETPKEETKEEIIIPEQPTKEVEQLPITPDQPIIKNEFKYNKSKTRVQNFSAYLELKNIPIQMISLYLNNIRTNETFIQYIAPYEVVREEFINKFPQD